MTEAQFTKSEQRLVDALQVRPGEWWSQESLVRVLYGYLPARGDPTLAVRVHIVAIRKKLGPDRGRLESCQHRKRGYRWVDVDPEAAGVTAE